MTYKPADLTQVAWADLPAALQSELERIAQELKPPPAWSCDWERPLAEYGFSLQAKDPSRFSNVQIAQGMRGARLQTRSGDSNVAGSGANERCDLRLSNANTDGVEGREQWWEHTIVFPVDYVDPPQSNGTWNFGVVFDFHNTADQGGQANFQILAMPRTATSPDRPIGLNFQINSGDPLQPDTTTQPIGPIERGIPYRFKYHVKWTSGVDGFFDATVNGEPKLAYRGPTLYPGQGVYLKLANYHSPYGKASAVLHGPLKRLN